MEKNTNTNTPPTVKTIDASTAQNDWSKREIGALWKREGKSQKYLSGHVKFTDEFGSEKKLDIQIFSNKSKKSDTQPDFRIYFNDKSNGKSAPAQPVKTAATVEQEEVI